MAISEAPDKSTPLSMGLVCEIFRQASTAKMQAIKASALSPDVHSYEIPVRDQWASSPHRFIEWARQLSVVQILGRPAFDISQSSSQATNLTG